MCIRLHKESVKIALIFTLICYSHQSGDFNSALEDGDEDNPGAVLRVTKKGIAYFVETTGEILNNVIKNLRIKEFGRTMTSGFVKGTVTLKDVKVYKFKKPKKYIGYPKSPDKLVFKIDDLKLLGLEGYMDINLNLAKAHGPIKGDIEHLDMELVVSVDEDDGKPKLSVEDCKVNVKGVKLHTDKLKGSGSGLIKSYKGTIESKSKGMLSDQMCKQAKRALEGALNEQFKKLSGRYPLKSSDASSSEEQAAERIEELLYLDLEKYSFDYDFLDKPKITNSYFQSKHKGEISYKGRGRTPFSPKRFSDMSSKSSRHIYMQISDYTISSLLYHAYEKGLRIKANHENLPTQKSYLQTKCKSRSKKCFGNVVPTAREDYPDHWIEMRHTPSEAPYCLIEDKKIKTYFEGDLSDSAMRSGGKRDKIIEAEATGTMSLKPRINGESLHGLAKIEDLSIDIQKGKVVSEDKFRLFTKEVLKQHLNAVFKEGIPLPVIEYTSLKKTDISVDTKGAMVLETDIKIAKKELTALATAAAQAALDDLNE